jgi:hypothetical protein
MRYGSLNLDSNMLFLRNYLADEIALFQPILEAYDPDDPEAAKEMMMKLTTEQRKRLLQFKNDYVQEWDRRQSAPPTIAMETTQSPVLFSPVITAPSPAPILLPPASLDIFTPPPQATHVRIETAQPTAETAIAGTQTVVPAPAVHPAQGTKKRRSTCQIV